MTKFHINAKGDAGKCTARVDGCPFGDENQHFPTAEAARAFFETSMDSTPTFTRQVRSSNGELVELSYNAEAAELELNYDLADGSENNVRLSSDELLRSRRFQRNKAITLENDASDIYRDSRFEPNPRVANELRRKDANKLKKWVAALEKDRQRD